MYQPREGLSSEKCTMTGPAWVPSYSWSLGDWKRTLRDEQPPDDQMESVSVGVPPKRRVSTLRISVATGGLSSRTYCQYGGGPNVEPQKQPGCSVNETSGSGHEPHGPCEPLVPGDIRKGTLVADQHSHTLLPFPEAGPHSLTVRVGVRASTVGSRRTHTWSHGQE